LWRGERAAAEETDGLRSSRSLGDGRPASMADAPAPEAVGRPKRERKQVERIRSSELRTANKRVNAGQGAAARAAGKPRGKARSSTGSAGAGDDDDEEEADEEQDEEPTTKKARARGPRRKGARPAGAASEDDEDEGDLDVPLAVRKQQPAEAEKPRKRTPRGAALRKAEKRRVSDEEEDGPDPDSEEASSIRMALMAVCDELGEEVLAETTPKVLRRTIEKRMKKEEGDLDEWKKLIIEWYELGGCIKVALRKFLQDLDEDAEVTPKAIRRELEQQLDLDEGDLDCWKTVIDTWITKFNDELTALSPLPTRSPKPKPASRPDAPTEDAAIGDSAADKQKCEPQQVVAAEAESANEGTRAQDSEAVQLVESANGPGGVRVSEKKRSAQEDEGASEVNSRPEKKRTSAEVGIKIQPATDSMEGGKGPKADSRSNGGPGEKDSETGKRRSEGSGKEREEGEKKREKRMDESQDGRGEKRKLKDDDVKASEKMKGDKGGNDGEWGNSKEAEKRRDSIGSDSQGRRDSKENDKERRSGEHKERDKERADKREHENHRAGKHKDGKETGEHGGSAGVLSEPSERPNDGSSSKASQGSGPGEVDDAEGAGLLVRVSSGSSKLLERRALSINMGKDLSLLSVKPIRRESSQANEFRACPLQDLDELQKVVAAAEQEVQVRRLEEEKAAARRAQEEREAAARRAQDERAREKIRQTANKPLPSFKDLMKKKGAPPPPNVSTSSTDAHSTDGTPRPDTTSLERKGGAQQLAHRDRAPPESSSRADAREDTGARRSEAVVIKDAEINSPPAVSGSPKVRDKEQLQERGGQTLTPNTKSLQQYVGAKHVGDILVQWGVISQEQVCRHVCVRACVHIHLLFSPPPEHSAAPHRARNDEWKLVYVQAQCADKLLVVVVSLSLSLCVCVCVCVYICIVCRLTRCGRCVVAFLSASANLPASNSKTRFMNLDSFFAAASLHPLIFPHPALLLCTFSVFFSWVFFIFEMNLPCMRPISLVRLSAIGGRGGERVCCCLDRICG